MDTPVYYNPRQHLSEFKDAIPYRPALRVISTSATAAIFLQQVIYWWDKSGRKPFYKFNEPSTHALYKPGDSWTEELMFTLAEFTGARDRVAFKANRHVRQQFAANFDPALEISPTVFVMYWTDNNRLTWYQLNEVFIDAALYWAYSLSREQLIECHNDKHFKLTFRNSEKAVYVTGKSLTYVMSKLPVTLNTETTSKTTAKNKKNLSAAAKSAAGKLPKLGKKHTPYFAAAFETIADQSVATLEGTEVPVELCDLEQHGYVTIDCDSAVIAYWLTPEGESYWSEHKDQPPFAAKQNPLFNAVRDHLNVKGSLPAKFVSELKIDYPTVTPEQIIAYSQDYTAAFPKYSYPQWNKIATSFGEWVRGEWGRNKVQQPVEIEIKKKRKVVF